MSTGMNIDAYLARIGIESRPEGCTAANLRMLQTAHLTHIPYDTVDIVRGVPFTLEPEAIYDKVVNRRRGGYCFELNGLFAWLLRALGYPVTEYFGRFIRDKDPGIPMRRHRVLIAATPEGERYIMDVGVGVSIPREPLKLEESVQGQYEVRKDPFFGWVLYDRGRVLYAFTEEPQITVDVEAAHFWCRFAPESPFIPAPMIAIRTADGRITLDGDALRFHTPDGVREEYCPEGEKRDFALKEYFGIVL